MSCRMWLLSPPKQSRGSQCAREARLGPVVRGVTRDRSPLGLSLAGSEGGRRDGKDSLAVAAALPRCACACMCTCVCVYMGVHGCLPLCTRVGRHPCRGGTRLCCTPLGLSLQRKVGQPPPGRRALQFQPPAFQPTPGAECGAGGGEVGVSGTLQHWGPLACPSAPAQLPWLLVRLPLSLPYQSWLQIHASHPFRPTASHPFRPTPLSTQPPRHLPALRCHERPGLSPTSFPGGSGVLCLMLGHVGTGMSSR